MKAEILAVGTELLLGDILNTNAQFLAQELANLGIEVYYQTVVGDNPQRLKDTIFHAFSRADLIITTGGLGPTEDDLTKETAAERIPVTSTRILWKNRPDIRKRKHRRMWSRKWILKSFCRKAPLR